MRRLAAILLCAYALPAFAMDTSDPAAKARAYAAQARTTWAADPVILAAVQDQNLRHAALTQSDIDALDKAWMSELGKPVQPVINSVLTTVSSDMLRAQVEQASGLITEVFVMDALGLNVASSGITSDYWQGDEAKFTETYPKGADAIHVSDVNFDESTQIYQVQVSFTLTDPADGTVIGAVTVGLNAEHL
ncbi:MAG: PDC sensor domain-containing protein [Pseudotabrizicola sp.]|uniref:PDC sensor domain-containing protein n=1 Tax=Pseudotabrizicola sp. TaxID=2939647 RepID=UPI00272F0129|nr:PDC sensor domain-containing protein [Pseudotabrizicola sp.]MDP2081642.1 PDC sensor domain-containing protein [Pseudotabrizicola sp.]MDZ7575078.1 PDC sensor domain-containing protein [Pseudotabrizicola sp.]